MMASHTAAIIELSVIVLVAAIRIVRLASVTKRHAFNLPFSF